MNGNMHSSLHGKLCFPKLFFEKDYGKFEDIIEKYKDNIVVFEKFEELLDEE